MPSPFPRAAQAALKAAAKVGATESVTLHRVVSEYDEATGVNSTVPTDYAWERVVVSEYADRYVDGSSVKAGDRLVIGAAADLAVTPDAETDELVLADGKTYSIVRVRTDPAGATYELQVRR